jgi:hypothetical protein
VPDDKAVLVIESDDSITGNEKATAFVRAGLDESFAAIVKGKLPPTKGAPERTPVPAAIVSPLGSFPAVTDQL